MTIRQRQLYMNRAKTATERPILTPVDAGSRPAPAPTPMPRRSENAIHTIATGNVRTVIHANRTAWGDIVWKVEQFAVYSRPTHQGQSKSFVPGELQDVMRGAYQASRWIHKVQKRLNRRRFWFGLFGMSPDPLPHPAIALGGAFLPGANS